MTVCRTVVAWTTGHPKWVPELEHQGQNGHAKNEEGGGRGRTGAGAVEREGEIGNGCVCLVPE